MASKESGMTTVAAPRIRNPGLTAWIGMLVVAAAGFAAGSLLQTDTSGTATAEKTATASSSVEAAQQSRALNAPTTSKRSLPTLNLDAVGDLRALNVSADALYIGQAADAARLQAAADYYLGRSEHPALTLPKRGERVPYREVSSLYTPAEKATMAAVAGGLVPRQVLESENFLLKKFINQGLIPRQAALAAPAGR
jgi:hypothetical protein